MKEEESQVIQLGKNNILIYNNVLASTKRLTDAQLGAVLRLLLAKNIDNNVELLHDDALVELTSHLLWDTISACNKNHAKKSEQQKAAGRASAEARRRKQAELEAKAEQAEKLNTVEPEATEVEDNQLSKKTVQLQKTQQPPKQQQLQKEQQLDWQCVAGLELTEQQQQEAIRIRKANNTTKKTRTFTQASLKQFLTQVKYSLDAGISIDEVLEKWEAKQWVTWTHSYYAKEIASDIKAQSQTAKDLKRVQASQEDVKDNDWDNFVITPLVKSMVEDTIKDKIEQSKKGGN